MRWHRIAAVLVSVVAIAVVGYVALRHFGIEPARDLVVQRLEAITGREVTIAGDFDLAAALAPTLAARGVVIANAAWASDAPMVEAERIEIELQLVPLLWQGDVVIDRLALSGAEVLLETGAGERVNWRFEAPAPEAVAGERREFLLNDLAIEDSRLRWHDLETQQTRALAVDRLAWQAPEVTSALALTGSGQVDGQPFELAGELGPLTSCSPGRGPTRSPSMQRWARSASGSRASCVWRKRLSSWTSRPRGSGSPVSASCSERTCPSSARTSSAGH